MQVGSDGKKVGTGRLSEAVAKQALEAAEAAREAAREAAAERAKAAAAERAKAAAAERAKAQTKAHTQRLNHTAEHLEAHPMPWQAKAAAQAPEKAPATGKLEQVGSKLKETGKLANNGAAMVQTGIGMVLGSGAVVAYKNYNSIKGKITQIKNVAADMKAAVDAGKGAVEATGGMAKQAADATATANRANVALGNKALNGMSKLQKLDSGLRVLSGVNSALNLRKSIGALKDGATVKEVNQVAADALGALRGADAASKLLRNGTGLISKKFNPVLAIAGAATDSVRRVQNLSHWKELSTKDKVANIAYLAGNVADVVGAVTPPPVNVAAKAIGAGLGLVGMAAENFEAVKKGATAVAHKTSEVAHKASDAAKEGWSSFKSFAKKVFSER